VIPPDPFRLAWSALLRPSTFADYLRGGGAAWLWAGLCALLWLVCTAALLWAVALLWAAIDPRLLLGGFGAAVAFALLLSAMLGQLTSASAGVVENTVFWVVRCLLATIPCLSLLTLGYGLRGQGLANDLALALAGATIGGALACGALVVALLRLRERAAATATRYILAAGAAVVAAELRWSALLPSVVLDLLVLFLVGCVSGLLRPLSWLWQAPLSLGLSVGARAGAPITLVRALNPASFDELGILPLPGLSTSLVQACAADLEAGANWLLDVAAHPGHAQAARAAVRAAAGRANLAHPLLFWLSTCSEGAALLGQVARAGGRGHALISAYAALASVGGPDEWPYVIARNRPAFEAVAGLPGGAAMLALLTTGERVLLADRWPLAVAGARSAPIPDGVVDEPVWAALRIVQDWAADPQPAFAADQEWLIGLLLAELADLDGWPVDLLAAIAEHLRYLIRVEQQRGALLV